MFRTLCVIFILGITGCAAGGLSPVFVKAVEEHKIDTSSVNNSLINTLQEEMSQETRPEAIEAYQEIINNLSTVSHQSDVLHRYVMKELTEEELIRVLRSRWRSNP